MSASSSVRLTQEEYLAFERAARTKSEYLDGKIREFPGANRAHVLITVNVGSELSQALSSTPCETLHEPNAALDPSDKVLRVPGCGRGL